ncbi:protein SAWADEE HOMEODOMAIN HOMOLOG 2 isoform X2 [Primulina huaijiensis]|uniref:protein SAWADEE HOMEODOMAIN HOMOLOG 2 isoform X2 n=1 Tax=Primulina huaijiensis TaxID=1492673 RepID=UPI003CC748F6
MGRPPSNGGPSFRFNGAEVVEMDSILQAHGYTVPSREILEAIAQRFSNTAERSGKVEVSAKQVWNWFQNRRYALRAKATKAPVPEQVFVPSIPRDDQAVARNLPPTPQPQPVHSTAVKSVPQVTHSVPAPSAQNANRNASDNSQMEFEAKSARDGAWYDVASFLSHRSLETADPEVLVRFAGFGPEEDEWVNINRHVRQRSLPCESSECVAVLPGDLTLCFQEGKEQALYFDAHVLDAQRRRHDVRGCRCRFLVRYDHDQAEEIVPLRKVCRRPETDYRLQQLHAGSANVNPQKIGLDLHFANSTKISVPDGTQKQPKTEEHVDGGRVVASPVTPPHAPATVESTLVPSSTTETRTETAVVNSNPSDAATVPSGSNLSLEQG